MVRATALASAALLVSSPGTAREWPDVAGWSVIQAETSCGLMMTYEGKGATQLVLGMRADGGSFLQLTNTGWSAEDGAEYKIDWTLNGSTYSGDARGVGGKYESRKGFVGVFGPELLVDFEKAGGLTVRRGQTVVDDLSLRGTAAALVSARRCLAVVRSENAAAEAEVKRLGHIADDPFAKADADGATDAGAASPEASWISTDDYPPSSIRASEQGAVTVSYRVNTAGRVEGCQVVKSSGSSALDRGTCAALTRRGRFSPSAAAKDRTFTYDWKLPPDVR